MLRTPSFFALCLAACALPAGPTETLSGAGIEPEPALVVQLRWDPAACPAAMPVELTTCDLVELVPLAGTVPGCPGPVCLQGQRPDVSRLGLSQARTAEVLDMARENHLVARGVVEAGRFVALEAWTPLLPGTPTELTVRVGTDCDSTALTCYEPAMWAERLDGTGRIPLDDLEGVVVDELSEQHGLEMAAQLMAGSLLAAGTIQTRAEGTVLQVTQLYLLALSLPEPPALCAGTPCGVDGPVCATGECYAVGACETPVCGSFADACAAQGCGAGKCVPQAESLPNQVRCR